MINLDQARGLLARAVLTQGPDFVYNPDGLHLCRYEPQTGVEGPRGITGCLVGVALALAGETRQEGMQASINGVTAAYPDMMDAAARVYFAAAQRAQDAGKTWGVAYAEAEKGVAEGDTVEAEPEPEPEPEV